MRYGRADTESLMDLSQYKNRKVLVTGHTGFKGSWMCRVLLRAGAEVTGYALEPVRTDMPSLFDLCRAEGDIRSVTGDIRDAGHLKAVFEEAKPEVVIHMAAQSIVRTGYREPLVTYETNVMGTANLLECVRTSDNVRSVVAVTTDKVYRPVMSSFGERIEAFSEDDRLGGYDPYSASKSCAEIVADSYRESYLLGMGIPVSTMRAGTAIGGGDFGTDRLMPDCVRSALRGDVIVIRNPEGVRPYQHVLDPVCAYLHAAAAQLWDPSLQGAYNTGPDEAPVTNEELVKRFCLAWNKRAGGSQLTYVKNCENSTMTETPELRISNDKIHKVLGWENRFTLDEAIQEMIGFTTEYMRSGDIAAHMDKWIKRYCCET